MKKYKFGLSKSLLLFVFVVCAASASAFAQTANFTYQGRLTDANSPSANGNYDFQFTIFDNANNQVGAPLTKTNVPVTNGIFTVLLSVSPTLFMNNTFIFLEIAVKRPQDATFTTLTPRQFISSAPFAVQSLNAGLLGGLSSGSYVQTSDPRLSDARVPVPGSSDYIQNSTVGQNANFKIIGSGTVFGTMLSTVVDASTEYRLNGLRILDADGGNNLYVGMNTTTNTGNNNTWVGVAAGLSNTSGGGNSFFGSVAGGPNKIGSNNSFFGYQTGGGNSSGNDNSFFGMRAGGSGNANANSFFGKETGFNNNTGGFNSFFGYQAGFTNNTGTNNTFIGAGAGIDNFGGSNNTFIGNAAGSVLTGGSNNTMLGASANVTAFNLSYATAVGSDSAVSTNNTIALGRANGADTVLAYGRIQVNTLGSAGSQSLCRNASFQISTCSSSLRYKTSVAPFTSGLSLIEKLQPITFRWKTDGTRDLGFGAEDVARVEPLLITYNEKGETEGVKYDRISAALVNAVKEQQAQIDMQKKQIEDLRAIVCAIKPDASVCKDQQ